MLTANFIFKIKGLRDIIDLKEWRSLHCEDWQCLNQQLFAEWIGWAEIDTDSRDDKEARKRSEQ